MSLLDSVTQAHGTKEIDPLQVAIDKLQTRKIHWWNIITITKLLVKALFLHNHRIKVLEAQVILQAEASTSLLTVIQIQQQQIELLSERKNNE